MPLHRILTFIFAVIAFASSIFLYVDHFWLAGFPDGFVTDLERARQALFASFITESIVFGVMFLFLGFRGSPRKNVNVLILVYALSSVAIFIVNAYLPAVFTGSGGG